jgi:hypothetical protein
MDELNKLLYCPPENVSPTKQNIQSKVSPLLRVDFTTKQS